MQLEADLDRKKKPKEKEEYYLTWWDEPRHAEIWILEPEPWHSWKEEPGEFQNIFSEESGFMAG